jgi:hypothetical protein
MVHRTRSDGPSDRSPRHTVCYRKRQFFKKRDYNMIRKAIISLLALAAIALALPRATLARDSHHRSHVGLGYGPYGPPHDGYRPYFDSCHSVRYRVVTASGSHITCGWGPQWFN